MRARLKQLFAGLTAIGPLAISGAAFAVAANNPARPHGQRPRLRGRGATPRQR